MAPRRARSRPGARSRATKSLTAAVSGSPRGRKSPDSAEAQPDPANAHGPESARAAARTPPELGADARDIEQRLSPRRPCSERAPRRCARFAPPRPGGRVDNGGTTGQVGGKLQDASGILGEAGATDEPGVVQAPRRRRRRLHQPGPTSRWSNRSTVGDGNVTDIRRPLTGRARPRARERADQGRRRQAAPRNRRRYQPQGEEARRTHRRLTTGTHRCRPTCRRRFCWNGESASTR